MTIFELVKVALDGLYEEGKQHYGASLDSEIRKRMVYLQTSYGLLSSTSRKPVDYKDPATRFAYVYKYVAAHGDYIVQVMQLLREELMDNIFDKGSIRVSCIGGGPGSDIIALLKYLSDYKNKEPVNKITCYLLDSQQAWADTWTELDSCLEMDVALNVNFQPLDVTKPESWQSQKKFLQADLFTMSYFVSEVIALDVDGAVTEFWKKLFADAKTGALFLYSDNDHTDFNLYFDKLWKAAGLECVVSDERRFTPRFSEQSAELGEYLKKFDHRPKLQAKLCYRVLLKP